ncbi:MAG: hypothetical protein J6H18_06070 [Lachnospiraceae bacterium]|nr:hypothetical protein [Lachnospiraceae bacterium]
MKKALAIVLCLMMLVLSACGSPQDKLVGKWKLTKVSGSTTDSDMSLFVEAG